MIFSFAILKYKLHTAKLILILYILFLRLKLSRSGRISFMSYLERSVFRAPADRQVQGSGSVVVVIPTVSLGYLFPPVLSTRLLDRRYRLIEAEDSELYLFLLTFLVLLTRMFSGLQSPLIVSSFSEISENFCSRLSPYFLSSFWSCPLSAKPRTQPSCLRFIFTLVDKNAVAG